MLDICIADDEVLIQKSITVKLRSSGMPIRIVGVADNTETAIGLYWAKKPDIFYVDINMPGSDGLSLIHRIRQEDPHCTTKFIIITGYDDYRHMREAIQNGVMDYLKKPISSDDFCRVLENAVRLIEMDRRIPPLPEWDMCYYEDYLAASPPPLAGGTLLVAHSPLTTALLEQDGNICSVLKAPAEKGLLKLSFKNTGYVRCYYNPDRNLPVRELLKFHNPIREAKISFVYVYPRADDLATLIERIEAGLNRRFLKLVLEECPVKEPVQENFDIGMLAYALEHGQNEGCHRSIALLFHKIKQDAIIGLSSLYRQIILLLINTYVVHNYSIPEDLKRELELFALCRFPTLEAAQSYLCGRAATLSTLIRTEETRYELIPAICEYLNKNYGRDNSLQELADRFYVSAPYLSRRFKEKTGATLMQYLEDIRMEKAGELLIHSDISITDISIRIGYIDPNYFSKIFKKKYLVSPTDYRGRTLRFSKAVSPDYPQNQPLSEK